jgi:gliding motility-associated-like protein
MVKEAPIAQFVLSEDACLDQIITVQAAWNSLNNSSYSWDFGDATVINGAGAGAYKLKWTSAGEKVISLVASGGGCKSRPFLDTINIHPDPPAKIEGTIADHICVGDEIMLQAKAIDDGNSYDYQWRPQEFFGVNGVEQVLAKINRKGYVYLHVSDEFGCTGTDSVMINADGCCDVFLPDAFTPNNDGKNDIFRGIGKGNHLVISFRIMNRWGQTVFESGDTKAGWDGTLGGAAQPLDTYFYYLKYECGTKEIIEKKGELTLIR